MSEAESKKIKLFIDDQEVRHFDHETKVRDIILLLLGHEDGHLFLGDSEEPLALELALCELGIEKHGHVHASHCKRVEVTVEYAGQSHTHKFPPNIKVKAVKDWAVSQKWETAIDPAERPKFGLFLPDNDEPLPEARRIGTYVAKEKCEVTFELALRERQQG